MVRAEIDRQADLLAPFAGDGHFEHALQPSEGLEARDDAVRRNIVQSGAAECLVGRAGLEPATLGLRVPCTASCANGPEPF